jgi:hypothetical protein
MDNPQNVEDKRNIVLMTLYRLATRGTKSHVDVYDLERLSDIGDEFKPALDFLRHKQLLVKRNLKIQITASGMEKAERIMAETYRSKERRVLQKLYDERDRRYTNPHQPDELARELNLDLREAQDIVVELERKGLTDGNDQATWIIAAGLEEIESGGQRPGAAPGVSFTTNIHGPNYGGIQQGGQGNTQNVTLTNTNNADFDRALTSIVELIRASNLPADDKQELEGEVGNVNKLALREPAPGLLDRAKSRLDMVRLGLQGTDLLIKAGPHLETAWEFLKQRFGG